MEVILDTRDSQDWPMILIKSLEAHVLLEIVVVKSANDKWALWALQWLKEFLEEHRSYVHSIRVEGN